MGNCVSPLSGEILKTAAISSYMKVTKPQILTIRDELRNDKHNDPRRRHRGMVRRAVFQKALDYAGVRMDPDQDIFNLLFTMWDTSGSGLVASAELVVGVSVLACRYDGVEDAIRFALEVSDRHGTRMISPQDASALLRSICATASYFGDQLLHLRQIYKVVDSVFETMTLISNDAEDLSHDKFTKLVLKQPIVAELVATGPRRSKAVSFALSNNSIETGGHTSVSSSSFADGINNNLDNQGSESSNSSSSSSSAGSSTDTAQSRRNIGKNDLRLATQPKAYRNGASAVPHRTAMPSLFVHSSSNPSSSIISDGDASSINPLKPITRISIHTGDDSS